MALEEEDDAAAFGVLLDEDDAVGGGGGGGGFNTDEGEDTGLVAGAEEDTAAVAAGGAGEDTDADADAAVGGDAVGFGGGGGGTPGSLDFFNAGITPGERCRERQRKDANSTSSNLTYSKQLSKRKRCSRWCAAHKI